jgi:hypothetical protein
MFMFATGSPGSNQSIFAHHDYGSPNDGVLTHISSLCRLHRLDYGEFGRAGEIIYRVVGDSSPTSQEEENARIATIQYATKKLGNPEDGKAFILALNAICEGADEKYRRSVAQHFYSEITERDKPAVLKDMGILGMQLKEKQISYYTLEELDADPFDSVDELGRNSKPFAEEREPSFFELMEAYSQSERWQPELFYNLEKAWARQCTAGRRKGASFLYDELTEWLNDLERGGASVEELDQAFENMERMLQYDEGGAIYAMSSLERVLGCGRMDPEHSADDLLECLRCTTDLIEEDIANEIRIREEIRLKEARLKEAGFPKSEQCETDLSDEEIAKKIRLRHAGHINFPNMLHMTYVNGESLEGAWATIEEHLNMLFPVGAVGALGQPTWSMANLTTGRADRIPFYKERERNFHLESLQNNEIYGNLYRAIRRAINIGDENNPPPGTLNSIMREASAAREKGALSTLQFDYLTKAVKFQKDYLNWALDRAVGTHVHPNYSSWDILAQLAQMGMHVDKDKNYRIVRLSSLQTSTTYADLYRAIRRAINTGDEKNPAPGTINRIMREASAAKENGALSTLQFDYLTKAAKFKHELMSGVMTRLNTDRLLVLQAPRRFSHANRETQRVVTEVLECILDQLTQDHHKTAMRVSRLKSQGKFQGGQRSYARFYNIIRRADDPQVISDKMKEAFRAKEEGCLSMREFTGLTTASKLQRERLSSVRPSPEGYELIREIITASDRKRKYLRWAMYGDNDPSHPIHKLRQAEVSLLWDVMKACEAVPVSDLLKEKFPQEILEIPHVRDAVRAVIRQKPHRREPTPKATRPSQTCQTKPTKSAAAADGAPTSHL